MRRAADRAEHCMKARMHPPFTHQEYLACQTPPSISTPAMRNNNATLALLYVLYKISESKANGNVSGYNSGRHAFIA
jgi:hypothetical protein